MHERGHFAEVEMDEEVIQSLFCNGWHTCGSRYRHSGREIVAIVSDQRPGQMAMVTWYRALDKNRSCIAEFNGACVEEIRFEAAP